MGRDILACVRHKRLAQSGVVSQPGDISALLQDLRKPLGCNRSTGSVTGTRMCSLAPLKSKQSGNARAHRARRSPV